MMLIVFDQHQESNRQPIRNLLDIVIYSP